MTLNGREFYTRDTELQKYIDTLMKDFYVEMPPRYAQIFGRSKAVRQYRDVYKKTSYITIADDRKFKRSAIKIKKPLTIKKEGNKYFFELSL